MGPRKNAQVVELVDTQDLKSCNHCDCAGSSPAPGTRNQSERGERERNTGTLIFYF
jgi:hypothetical protein